MPDSTRSAARSATSSPTITVATRNERRADYWTAVSNAVLLDTSLSDAAVRLYALLLMYANQGDGCSIRQADIARDMGRTERSIRRTLGELETAGLISTEQPGLTLPNVYLVEPSRKPAGKSDPAPPVKKPVPSERTRMSAQLRSGGLSGQKCPARPDNSVRSGADKNDRSFKEKNPEKKNLKEEVFLPAASLGKSQDKTSQDNSRDKTDHQRQVYRQGTANFKSALQNAARKAKHRPEGPE